METTIYLWVENEGWKPFKLSDTDELSKRTITIGDGATIGYGATIGDSATIGYGATIGDRAKIGSDATIGSDAKIGDDATIGDSATIGYGATIGDRAKIGSDATIRSGATIGYGATIGDRAKIGKTLFITASRRTINYYGLDAIHIGSKVKTIAQWREEYKEMGESQNYSPEQIEEYKGYIELIATLHQTWKIEENTEE